MEVRGRRREAVQTQYQMHINDRLQVPFTFASTSTQNGTDIESRADPSVLTVLLRHTSSSLPNLVYVPCFIKRRQYQYVRVCLSVTLIYGAKLRILVYKSRH